MNIPCICINDAHRPNEIPANRWPKKDKQYTIIQIDKLITNGGIMGVKLAEINIDDCAPYQYFAASRFAIVQPVDDQVEENIESLELVDDHA